MLASLTGLLLTLGGDQPAVVFDPPLDPAIFDWDGQTLSVKPESLPLDLSFAGQQKINQVEETQASPIVFDHPNQKWQGPKVDQTQPRVGHHQESTTIQSSSRAWVIPPYT